MEDGYMEWPALPVDFVEESSEQDLQFAAEAKQMAKTALKDSFQLYLQEISTFPLLSAEEEVALAKRVAAGNPSARQDFINSNLRLVVSVAKRYYKKKRPSHPGSCE